MASPSDLFHIKWEVERPTLIFLSPKTHFNNFFIKFSLNLICTLLIFLEVRRLFILRTRGLSSSRMYPLRRLPPVATCLKMKYFKKNALLMYKKNCQNRFCSPKQQQELNLSTQCTPTPTSYAHHLIWHRPFISYHHSILASLRARNVNHIA